MSDPSVDAFLAGGCNRAKKVGGVAPRCGFGLF